MPAFTNLTESIEAVLATLPHITEQCCVPAVERAISVSKRVGENAQGLRQDYNVAGMTTGLELAGSALHLAERLAQLSCTLITAVDLHHPDLPLALCAAASDPAVQDVRQTLLALSQRLREQPLPPLKKQ